MGESPCSTNNVASQLFANKTSLLRFLVYSGAGHHALCGAKSGAAGSAGSGGRLLFRKFRPLARMHGEWSVALQQLPRQSALTCSLGFPDSVVVGSPHGDVDLDGCQSEVLLIRPALLP